MALFIHLSAFSRYFLLPRPISRNVTEAEVSGMRNRRQITELVPYGEGKGKVRALHFSLPLQAARAASTAQQEPLELRRRHGTCCRWSGWMGKATWWEGGEIITERAGGIARGGVGMPRRVKGGCNRGLGLLGGRQWTGCKSKENH